MGIARTFPLLSTTPPKPWQLYYSSHLHSLNIPLNFPHLGLHSRGFVISHAIRTRNDRNVINFVTSKFGYDNEDDAEFVRKKRMRSSRKRSRQRQWWSGNNQVEGEQVGGVVDQLVDDLWMLQVFRSYGLFLPFILISLLLATGPKAFLMGSGVFFGLSLLAFTFNKLWQLLDFNPAPTRDPKSRRKRSGFNGRRDVSMDDKGSKTRETQQGERTQRSNYQNGASRFGGWDELVFEDETEEAKRPSVTEARLKMIRDKKVGSAIEKKKLPMVLRLLVALFPFLASWTDLV